jgi:hypothetical protein
MQPWRKLTLRLRKVRGQHLTEDFDCFRCFSEFIHWSVEFGFLITVRMNESIETPYALDSDAPAITPDFQSDLIIMMYIQLRG